MFSQKPPFGNIELLSVHIPKTAGQSFLKILNSIYGRHLLRIYEAEDITRFNRGTIDHLPRKVTALHGHYNLNPRNRHLFPKAKIICWLRHPIDRLISHYHHWSKLPPHQNPQHDKFLKEKPSLREFIRDPAFEPAVNTYQAFLRALRPEDLFFAGRTENFKEDIYTLSALLEWPDIDVIPWENTGPSHRGSENITRRELEALLSSEIEIYYSFLNYFHSL